MSVSAIVNFFIRRFFDAKRIFGSADAAAEYLESLKRRADHDAAYSPPDKIFSLSDEVVVDTFRSPTGVMMPVVKIGHRSADKLIVYLPGGAYCRDPKLPQFRFISSLASSVSASCETIVYPKLPLYKYKDCNDTLFSYYASLLSADPEREIILVGDSAGAGLAVGLCARLRAASLPLPSKLLLICPFVNACLDDHAYRIAEKTDPMLGVDGISYLMREWADGIDLSDPLISQINGDLSCFPPTLIISGTYEMIRRDAVALFDRLKNLGCDVDIRDYDKMGHAFVFTPVPEAKKALSDAVSFLLG